jgi:hypothetical protein
MRSFSRSRTTTPIEPLETRRLMAATLTINDVELAEGNSGLTPFTFTVTRSGDTSGKNTVKYATDTKSAGTGDFIGKSGTLTFAPGDVTKTITVSVRGDTKIENGESFGVVLSQASNNGYIARATGRALIVNDDIPLPLVGFDRVLGTGIEGDGGTSQLVFEVELSRTWTQPVSVAYRTRDSTAGSGDYVATSGTLTFAPGETLKTFGVTIKGDTKVELDESLIVLLSNPTNANLGFAASTGTIRNDDGPALPPEQRVISFNDVASPEGSGQVTIEAYLSEPSDQTVTVQFSTRHITTDDSDFTAISGVITFQPGQVSKSVSVAVKNDATAEADEMFRVDFSNPVNAVLTRTDEYRYLLNDDPFK